MIILDSTVRKLEVVLGAAHTTTAPSFLACYVESTSTTYVPGANTGVANGTTDVTMVAAPGAGSTYRQVKFVDVWNADTVAHTVTIQYNDNGTNRVLFKVLIEAGWHITYTDGQGWGVFDDSGNLRTGGGTTMRGGRFASNLLWMDLANISTATAFTTNVSYAHYVGPAPRACSTLYVILRVATAVATITWSEVGVFTGDVIAASGPTLTRLGFLDTSGSWNSTGLKKNQVTLSPTLSAGDPVWIVLGTQATTVGQFRGGLADDLQTGCFATGTRPSTIASPTTWTLAGATQVPAWISVRFN